MLWEFYCVVLVLDFSNNEYSFCLVPAKFHNCPNVGHTVKLPSNSSSIELGTENIEELRDIYATSCSGERLEVDTSQTFSWSTDIQSLTLEVTDVKGLTGSCVIPILIQGELFSSKHAVFDMIYEMLTCSLKHKSKVERYQNIHNINLQHNI